MERENRCRRPATGGLLALIPQPEQPYQEAGGRTWIPSRGSVPTPNHPQSSPRTKPAQAEMNTRHGTGSFAFGRYTGTWHSRVSRAHVKGGCITCA